MVRMKIRFASVNCRGLNKQIKRKCIFKRCTEYDIICLQETYITKETAPAWKLDWGGEFYYSEGSSKSKGQIILVNKRLEYESIEVTYQTERILALRLKLNNESEPINIINVYGPAVINERRTFMDTLYAVKTAVGEEKVIFCGDFNMVLNNELDIISGAPHREEDVTRFKNWVSNCEIVDAWRARHGNLKEFTWSRPNPFTARRLDYIFCGEDLVPHINNVYHETIFATDHRMVALELQTNKFKKSSSFWKFNNSLLRDKIYIQKINTIIDESVVNPPCENKMMRWELLKAEIKANTIAFSIHKNRIMKDKERELQSNIRKDHFSSNKIPR